MKTPFTADILRQIYDETGLLETDRNMYEYFVQHLEKNYDINRNIIEVGGGIIPTLAKRIALKQKTGTVTVYDPRTM